MNSTSCIAIGMSYHRTVHLLPSEKIGAKTPSGQNIQLPVNSSPATEEKKSDTTKKKQKIKRENGLWQLIQEDTTNLLVLLKEIQIPANNPDISVLDAFTKFGTSDHVFFNDNPKIDACAYYLVHLGECIKFFNLEQHENSTEFYREAYEEYKLLTILRDEMVHHFPFERCNPIRDFFDKKIIGKNTLFNNFYKLNKLPSRDSKLSCLISLIEKLKIKAHDAETNKIPLLFKRNPKKSTKNQDFIKIFFQPFYTIISLEWLSILVNNPFLIGTDQDEKDPNKQIAFSYRLLSIFSILKDWEFQDKFFKLLNQLGTSVQDLISDDLSFTEKELADLKEYLKNKADELHNDFAHNISYTPQSIFENCYDLYDKSHKTLNKSIKFMLEWEKTNAQFTQEISSVISQKITDNSNNKASSPKYPR